MAPSPIPAPLPPWARALLQVAPFISPVLQGVLQHIHAIFDSSSSEPSEWRRFTAHWDVTSSAEPSDAYVTTWDIVNITGGTVDNSWTEADYGVVQTYLGQLCLDWAGRQQAGITFTELRAYRMSFNPVTNTKPFAVSGPPEFAAAYATVGNAPGFQAPQVAYTTTELTPYRKHWGRNYWPAPAPSLQIAGGHILATAVDQWCQLVHDAYQSLMSNEFFPVVAVTQIDNVPARALLTLRGVQMDDVPDVIRRRRPENATHRMVLPVTAQLLPA
jgi:hypothetical protein